MPSGSCGSLWSSQYPLTAGDEGKYLRAYYIHYNDDSGGSVVVKRAQAAVIGPVPPP